MTEIFAAVMGFVQGLTEFLPVSSSGHLVIFDNLFGSFSETPLNNDMFFKVLLHLGTLISVCLFYRRDIAGMARDVFFIVPEYIKTRKISSTAHRRVVWLIIVSLLPLFVIFPFKNTIENAFENLTAVGVLLLVTAALLYTADHAARGKSDAAQMPWYRGLFIGLFQTVAILPGISRSGSTITGGILCGLKREEAVRFSFLMSLPTILAAVTLESVDAIRQGFDMTLLLPCAIGLVVSAATGYFAIGLVRYIAKRGKFTGFSVYCAVVGAAVIIWSFVR